MSEDALLYFAYGANLNRKHMALWCPNSDALEAVILKDHRLVFRFWCDLQPHLGSTVPGAVYRLGEGDLKWLDEYEDCPRVYRHQTVEVQAPDGRTLEAMTYRMLLGHPFAPPDTEYLSIVRQGYFDWGYDPTVLPNPR
jgi:gamma-glutamylcyclotransferase (GGCT)/AIG2-like uncharacterized protein YtfP